MYDFSGAVDRTSIKSFGLIGRILNLQASFDVLDGCGDEADCHAGHDPRDSVAESGQLARGVFAGGGDATDW